MGQQVFFALCIRFYAASRQDQLSDKSGHTSPSDRETIATVWKSTYTRTHSQVKEISADSCLFNHFDRLLLLALVVYMLSSFCTRHF